MGILADVFVATPPEAATYEETLLRNYSVAVEQYKPVQLRNLLNLNFSTLWAILLEEEWDTKKHALVTIKLEPPGETWLFQFPGPYRELLAALTDEELERAAKMWVATEEFSRTSWTAEDTTSVIEELRRLSKEAVKSNESLYLWGSI